MTDPKAEVASAYGEGGIEADAMAETAAHGVPVPPHAPAGGEPVAGTTEADIAANQRAVAERAKAD